MHRGLPSVASIESVSFDSSESESRTSVNSTMLAWASEISPSGSWMSSYVLSANDVISICNAVVKISEVLEYSFPSLKSYNSTNQIFKTKPKSFSSLGNHLSSKSEHDKLHKIT